MLQINQTLYGASSEWAATGVWAWQPLLTL
jgi:hypothetical protein